VAEYLAECENGPAAILIDACVPRQYGGTGQTVDWHVLQPQRVLLQRLPLILAGGLGSDNVAQAISIMRPTAVDVASGVESEPGRKDADLVHRFVTAARAAFSSK
jgi:phosphoribosylanthranilate isomerase